MMNDKFEIRSRMSQRTIVSKFEKLNGVYASKNQTATIDCTKFSDGESQCKQLSSTKTTQRMVANLNSKKLFCDVVAVDSSSIVAQIIGKKGEKIKYLQMKYGVKIDSPNKDNEPVFVITGLQANVYEAKQVIIDAANHFVQIKARNLYKIHRIVYAENSITIKLYVPGHFVGLVVGINGWHIKNLRSKFNVYIEARKDPILEFNFLLMWGQQEQLIMAKTAIFDYIVRKTNAKLIELALFDTIYFFQTSESDKFQCNFLNRYSS